MRTPPRNSVFRTGELRCGVRTWPHDPACEETAIWHVAWLLSPRGQFTLVCEPHLAALVPLYDHVDRHPAAIDCDMPGTGWWTFHGEPSRCDIAPTLAPGSRGMGEPDPPLRAL